MNRCSYPAYKLSGIEWLGEVPESWTVEPVKYAFWLQRGYDLPVTDFLEGQYPVCGSNGIIGYHNDFTTKGPGVTVGRSGSVGEVNFIESDFWAHNTALYVKEFRQADARYVFYLLKSLDVGYLSEGTAVGTLNRNYIHSLKMAFPDVHEQHAIVAYLDRETSRIDALIEKKQKQIELLQEKRTALISHAVTKGLNPNVKMKDSGVEWLGEIPAHWEVRRVKRLGSIRYGLGEPPEYVDDGLPFIRATDINSGKIDLDTVKKVRPDDVPWNRDPSLGLYEILVVRSGAYTGDSALVTENTIGAIAGYDMVLTISKAYAPFVAWALLSRYMLQGQIYLERLRAAQPHLNAEELGGFVIMTPPYAEQRSIAAFLNRETARIDALVEKVKKSIALLREYRTSLISAAVTGKIDVRKEAA